MILVFRHSEPNKVSPFVKMKFVKNNRIEWQVDGNLSKEGIEKLIKAAKNIFPTATFEGVKNED